MTKKLFNAILSTCLLFSSLYLPAHAAAANQVPGAKAGQQGKKTPEAIFSEGESCLMQGNTACARLALANILSTSPYAKLLQGSIALTEKQTDKALLLLLPLQAEESLVPAAKITLHQHLADAFQDLNDIQQAIQHLMQAEAAMAMADEAQTGIAAIHEKIWSLLGVPEQSELVELRGNNTDSTFQGWIDLRLAASNADLNNSIAAWNTLYPDHPAQAFAKSLAEANSAKPAAPANLSSDGSIALIMPLTAEANAAKAEAFRLGLETALSRHGLHNEIRTYPSTESQQQIDEAYALAKSEGNIYFITPGFQANEAAGNKISPAETNNILHISPILDDEALHIVNFALSRGMQQITIITTENAASRLMAASFQAAWQSKSPHELRGHAITIITLLGNIAATDGSLFELKSQLTEKMPDLVLLAMTAPEARMARLHLPISTPVITYSSANEMVDAAAAYQPLNAVRLFEIPYLLTANQAAYQDYAPEDASLNSNELLRWFALGVDSLQLLIASQPLPEHEVTISGLTGTLTVDKYGNIKRQLPLARFTHSGLVPEQ
ncbi:penicillin-binding protein activator [Methylotenera sp. G11]|uniref:penicillin-binding protein activator n=1 Tax=Methylotenera sp. G11 TaxID=1506585 RepID=UPI000645FB7E|nr:penicillin-binding protein activator [Methylotenera sp. G11]